MRILLITTLFIYCFSAFAQNQQNDQYPILKFKKDKIKLWSYPGAATSLKIDVKNLGDPRKIKFIRFAGGSNEHIVITYQGKEYSFSKSKVLFSPDFDKRNSTAMSCTKANLNKNENAAETTSICENK